MTLFQRSLKGHAVNKIIRMQSLLRVIDCTTQSSGRGIKGGCPGRRMLVNREVAKNLLKAADDY